MFFAEKSWNKSRKMRDSDFFSMFFMKKVGVVDGSPERLPLQSSRLQSLNDADVEFADVEAVDVLAV